MDPIPSNAPMSAAPKSNRNMIIGIIVAVVLCCLCVVVAIGGYYAYQAYQVAQQTLQNIQIPTSFPIDPNNPDSPNIPVPGFSDAPQGGLADDLTRSIAWVQVSAYAAVAGCSSPQAQTTSITVTEQPDANGTWVEEWNVDCGDGSTQTITVNYTTDNGVVLPEAVQP